MTTLEKQLRHIRKAISGLQKEQRGTTGLDARYLQDRLDSAYKRKAELSAKLEAQQSYRGGE